MFCKSFREALWPAAQVLRPLCPVRRPRRPDGNVLLGRAPGLFPPARDCDGSPPTPRLGSPLSIVNPARSLHPPPRVAAQTPPLYPPPILRGTVCIEYYVSAKYPP